MTFKELYYVSIATFIKDEKEWEKIRWIGALLYNLNVKKGDHLSPQELLPLAIDSSLPKKELISLAEFNRYKNKRIRPIRHKLK